MVEGTRSSEMDSIERSSAGSDVIPVDSRKAPGKALKVKVKWSGMTSAAVTLARTSHHKTPPCRQVLLYCRNHKEEASRFKNLVEPLG